MIIVKKNYNTHWDTNKNTKVGKICCIRRIHLTKSVPYKLAGITEPPVDVDY